MTPEQIEAARADVQKLRNGLLYPWQHDEVQDRIHAAIDYLAKANEELRAEVGEQARLNGMGAEHELSLRATIDRLTKERDEARAQFDNHVVWASWQAAELEAKVARLTKGRDSFAASYTHAAEERDEARTRLSAMQEAIGEAVRRADEFRIRPVGPKTPEWLSEPLRPFATKPEVDLDVCPVCSGDCAGANPPVIFCPMQDHKPAKPTPEVDPLVAAITEAWPGAAKRFGDAIVAETADHLRTALCARGGRVVFDGREG